MGADTNMDMHIDSNIGVFCPFYIRSA